MGEIADEHVERFASGEWDMRHRHVPRVTDPLHYHTKLKFVRMTMTTEKAVRLELPQGIEIWVPRSVCRQWGEGVVWVHSKTLRKSMQTGQKAENAADLLADLPSGWEEYMDDDNPPF